MILPVAKLGALLMKTLGKPLASRLKAEAARHPRFRQIIIDFAQVRATYLSSPQLPAKSSLTSCNLDAIHEIRNLLLSPSYFLATTTFWLHSLRDK